MGHAQAPGSVTAPRAGTPPSAPASRPPDPADLVAAYGAPLLDVAWFRALAGLRLAALTVHYLRMHRTGQRPDATWEAFGASVPYILGRALAVLG